MVIKIGKNPNAVVLPDQDNNDVYLSDYQENYKLLSFHPLAWTSTCAGQMQSLEEHFDEFQELKIIPFGISVDPVPGKKAWAEKLGLKKLKILSDFYPLGFAARTMGVYLPSKGFSHRANILLDPEGAVVWTKVYNLDELPDINEVLKACREIV